MTKTEEKELMMLVPKAIRNSKDLTPKAKLLLGYLINLNGMEIVSEKGYFYITNEKINECLGTTNTTLSRYMNQLVNNGLISRNVGKRGKASEYRLLFETNLNSNNITENVTNNVTYNVTDKLDKLIEINSLILRELIKLNNRNVTYNVTDNVTLIDTTENVTKNVTTDTESDTDIEIEKELDLDIIKI